MKMLLKQPRLFGVALVCLTAGAAWGCKDFLTQSATPQGQLDSGTLANFAGVEGTLIAAYRTLDHNDGVGGNWGNASSNWIWGSVTSDDAYKGSEASDQPAIDPIEFYQWSAANVDGELNDKWRQSYEGVVRANSTLRLLKDVVGNKPAEIPADHQAGIEGEAIFLRAHYHFEAWRMWGNIPYYRETDTDFKKANLTSDAAIAEILKDLDAAIAKLPTTPRKGQIGRITQWGAKAYKGRVQMYAKQFPAALTTLREVRASNVFALEQSFDRVWTGFQAFANGKETILAYQASANDGDPNGNNANFGERLNFPHSGSHFGCCGFHQPSQNLVNFFATDAASGLPVALTNPTTWNSSNATLNAAASAGKTYDTRLDFTVGRDGVPYKDWGPHAPDWIRAPSYGGPYSGKKPMHEKASGAESSVGWVNTQLNSVNIHIFRYADMLLLLAEAEVEAGSLENARTIVNEIRTRAGVRAQGRGVDQATIAVAPTDPSITWASYKVGLYTTPFANQAAAREAVRTERRLELAMEGQRFFDLRRWGIADATLNAYLNGVAGGAEKTRRPQLAAAAAFSARHQWFPIPITQINLSKGAGGAGGLTQNTGW